MSAYVGAVLDVLDVLPTEMCGSEYEVARHSSYRCADIEWHIAKGFDPAG